MNDALPKKQSRGTWVQTERSAHEAWIALIKRSPLAAQVMHALTSRVDADNNAVVVSQRTLADLVQASERGVRKALTILRQDNWIEVRQIGDRGTVNAYVLNDRVVWSGARDGIRYSLFSASVVISSSEQPDADALGNQGELRRLPQIGEQQMPTGPGLPPPSEPALPGMEADLPAARRVEPDE